MAADGAKSPSERALLQLGRLLLDAAKAHPPAGPAGPEPTLDLLLHEGYEAALRAEVLALPVRERLLWMSKDADGFAHFMAKHFPEGLPDAWVEETGRASWAAWYRGWRDGR